MFAGEVSPEGRSLDNARTGDYLVDSRNVGIVLARPDFWTVGKPKDVLIPPGLLLTPGKPESGGFYTFGGTWSPQNDYGVVWLTGYRDKASENASRVEAAFVRDDGNIVFRMDLDIKGRDALSAPGTPSRFSRAYFPNRRSMSLAQRFLGPLPERSASSTCVLVSGEAPSSPLHHGSRTPSSPCAAHSKPGLSYVVHGRHPVQALYSGAALVPPCPGTAA